MAADTTRSIYNAWHARYEVDDGADAPWHQLVKQHLKVSRDLHHKRVLEIGAGRGGFACWLAKQRHRARTLVAADFAHTAVVKGKTHSQRHGALEIRWAIGDIQTLAHPDNAFDTVISCETIEHVPHPSLALRELARVLRPGGRLYLTTPNYLGTMGIYRIYLRLSKRRYTEEDQPINNPVILPQTLAWVRRAGLRVLVIDGIGHYLPFPRRPPIEIPMLNQLRWLTRWFGLHSLVVATKPLANGTCRP